MIFHKFVFISVFGVSNRRSHLSGQTAATEDRAEIKQTCGNLDNRVTDSAINVKRAAMAEVRNLEEKRRKLVILGVPESRSQVPTERIKNDKAKFAEVLSSIDIPVDIINSASRLVRLGKNNPAKASPLRAVMTSEVVKDDILSKARNLPLPGMKIKPDLA